jgi:hypothetical protein
LDPRPARDGVKRFVLQDEKPGTIERAARDAAHRQFVTQQGVADRWRDPDRIVNRLADRFVGGGFQVFSARILDLADERLRGWFPLRPNGRGARPSLGISGST